MSSNKLLLSPNECAKALGVSRNTVYDLLHGELSSFLIGTRRKIPVSEIERYISSQIKAQQGGHQKGASSSPEQNGGAK
jgi:excisionase family DNA binding protein